MKKALTLTLIVLMCVSAFSSCAFAEWLVDLRRNRTYTIHFNSNGGEGEMSDLLVEKGESGGLPKCRFTKDGYECLAWSMDADGTKGVGWINNLTFRLPMSVKNGDTVELYAVWSTPGFSFEEASFAYFSSRTITEYSGKYTEVTVPAYVVDSHVSTIRDGVFKDHTEIESVKNFPVSDIQDDLFYGCTALKSIEMKRGVSIYTIGDRAFYNCSALENIELTGNLDSIGAEAFYMCTSIEKLVIPAYFSEIGANAFYGWTEGQTIEFTKYSENPFGDEAFTGCNATIIWSGE